MNLIDPVKELYDRYEQEGKILHIDPIEHEKAIAKINEEMRKHKSPFTRYVDDGKMYR